jgi:hypothetical protein
VSVEESTRISIVEHALHDTLERLAELPRRADVEHLRALAKDYERQVRAWGLKPPDEQTRVSLLKKVLDLNVAVIRAGGERAGAAPRDPDAEVEEFPRPVRR